MAVGGLRSGRTSYSGTPTKAKYSQGSTGPVRTPARKAHIKKVSLVQAMSISHVR